MPLSLKPAALYKAERTPEGYHILADKNVITTPLGKNLSLPTLPLTEAIIDEWQKQKEKINFKTMPLTQLASAALDMSESEHTHAIDHLLTYIGSELLCHRAENPSALRAQQDLKWQPLLDWCRAQFDASLSVGSGIMPISQEPKSVQNLRKKMESYNSFERVGLLHATDISGSLVLGLALAEAQLSADDVFEASELDASFQIMTWQEDEETKIRRLKIMNDLYLCEKWFQLIRRKS